MISIHRHGPRTTRIGAQRPSSCRPIRGNCSRTRSERWTRSLVSTGRLCDTIMRSRSSTAGTLSLTFANVQSSSRAIVSPARARSRLCRRVRKRPGCRRAPRRDCVLRDRLPRSRRRAATAQGCLPGHGCARKPRRPGGVLQVERHIQPVARSLHMNERTTRTGTKRVPRTPPRLTVAMSTTGVMLFKPCPDPSKTTGSSTRPKPCWTWIGGRNIWSWSLSACRAADPACRPRDRARPDREAHPISPHPVTWAASLAAHVGPKH